MKDLSRRPTGTGKIGRPGEGLKECKAGGRETRWEKL